MSTEDKKAIASELNREIQARALLRSVSFEVTAATEEFAVPSYIRDPEAASSGAETA